MIINYSDIFWGDSTLEQIKIEYDQITVTIHNDATDTNIDIICMKCIGMTDIIVWDEVIIENVFLIKKYTDENYLLKKVKEIYGEESYDSEKSLKDSFIELKIEFINYVSFSIICELVEFIKK